MLTIIVRGFVKLRPSWFCGEVFLFFCFRELRHNSKRSNSCVPTFSIACSLKGWTAYVAKCRQFDGPSGDLITIAMSSDLCHNNLMLEIVLLIVSLFWGAATAWKTREKVAEGRSCCPTWWSEFYFDSSIHQMEWLFLVLLLLANIKVEEMNQFKYLGSTQTKDGTPIMEVKIRLASTLGHDKISNTVKKQCHLFSHSD